MKHLKKKNSIINLVIGNKPPQKVIPKPNYPAPERAQQKVEEPKNKPQPTEQAPKKAVSLKPKVGLNFADNISINAAPKEEKKNITSSGIEVTPENRPTEKFTPEQFAEKWKVFKSILEDKGKSNLASIFETVPNIENNTIKILVENIALEDEFKAQQSEFIDFIRLELSNYNIQVTTEINKEVTNKKAYTPQEKFTKMSEKNPQLKELVKKLDMDVGYA